MLHSQGCTYSLLKHFYHFFGCDVPPSERSGVVAQINKQNTRDLLQTGTRSSGPPCWYRTACMTSRDPRRPRGSCARLLDTSGSALAVMRGWRIRAILILGSIAWLKLIPEGTHMALLGEPAFRELGGLTDDSFTRTNCYCSEKLPNSTGSIRDLRRSSETTGTDLHVCYVKHGAYAGDLLVPSWYQMYNTGGFSVCGFAYSRQPMGLPWRSADFPHGCQISLLLATQIERLVPDAHQARHRWHRVAGADG